MKITDVTLTLFAWSGIPATTYGRHSPRFSGSSDLGLLTLRTDEGVEGHAFLGSSLRGAALDGASLIRFLKPLVMGQDPLERERLWQALWQRNRATTLRAIGAVDVALWDIAGKVAGLPISRLLGTYRETAPAYASSRGAAVEGGLRRGSGSLQARPAGRPTRSTRPPTRPWTSRCADAVRRAVGDDYTVMLDSTWAYQYPEALRVGPVIEELGFHWYEDPLADDDLYNYVKLKQQLDDPDPRHRVHAGRTSRPTRRGSPRGRPTTCAATSR